MRYTHGASSSGFGWGKGCAGCCLICGGVDGRDMNPATTLRDEVYSALRKAICRFAQIRRGGGV